MTIKELIDKIIETRYASNIFVSYTNSAVSLSSLMYRNKLSDAINDYYQIMRLISMLPNIKGYTITECFDEHDAKYLVDVRIIDQNATYFVEVQK